MTRTWVNTEAKNKSLIRKITLILAKHYVTRGEILLKKGLINEAFSYSQKALSVCNNLFVAHELMAKSLMPGDDYIDILSKVHNFLKPESYVEIGVFSGKSLGLANEDSRVVGIDPNPCIDVPIKSRAKLYPIRSDDFFTSYNLLDELKTQRLGLAFIDGLHAYEQTLKDFINIESYSDKNTIVFIHDCLPITRLVASRSRSSLFWCGDVWKIAPSLMKYRKDLHIHIIPTYPSGLGMVTNLDPKSNVLLDQYRKIVEEFKDQELEYDYLYPENIIKLFPTIIANNWQSITQLMPKR